jgi:hypothetical protein
LTDAREFRFSLGIPREGRDMAMGLASKTTTKTTTRFGA